MKREVRVAAVPCRGGGDVTTVVTAVVAWSWHGRGDYGDEGGGDDAVVRCGGGGGWCGVELKNEEFFDNEYEVAKVFRTDTNIFDFETPMCKAFKEFNYLLQIDPDLLTKDIEGFKTYEEYKNDWIYEWNRDIPWVDEKPWTDAGVWTEPTPVEHYCKPFNYKTGCSEWPTYSWKNDGYCNGGNLPGAYIVGNSLHYQDYEWYEA
ncbi:hypothetical protein Tco_0840766 [Tanacetum coccineum]|uniref:Uncharacterized protein n=1 Tax=Tanacetum coccineum TaxID=301880 RepID=A0ABQ5AWD3_9ASTR